MNKFVLCSLVLATMAAGAHAQAPASSSAAASASWSSKHLCETCGLVQSVKQVKIKGEGGAVGLVGGAVVGGVLGNQIGGGTGKTLATVGGAVGGAYVGNEIQKNVSSKIVWQSKIKMRDGTVVTHNQDAQPNWVAGDVLKQNGNAWGKR